MGRRKLLFNHIFKCTLNTSDSYRPYGTHLSPNADDFCQLYGMLDTRLTPHLNLLHNRFNSDFIHANKHTAEHVT